MNSTFKLTFAIGKLKVEITLYIYTKLFSTNLRKLDLKE